MIKENEGKQELRSSSIEDEGKEGGHGCVHSNKVMGWLFVFALCYLPVFVLGLIG